MAKPTDQLSDKAKRIVDLEKLTQGKPVVVTGANVPLRLPAGETKPPAELSAREKAIFSDLSDTFKEKALERYKNDIEGLKSFLNTHASNTAKEKVEGSFADYAEKKWRNLADFVKSTGSDIAEYLGAAEKRDGKWAPSFETIPVAVTRAGLNVANTPSAMIARAVYSKQPTKEALKQDFTAEGLKRILTAGLPTSEDYLKNMSPEELSAIGNKLKAFQSRMEEGSKVNEGETMTNTQAIKKTIATFLPATSDVVFSTGTAGLGLAGAGKGLGSLAARLPEGAAKKVASGTSKGLYGAAALINKPTEMVGNFFENRLGDIYNVPYWASGANKAIAGKDVEGALINASKPGAAMFRQRALTQSVGAAEKAIKRSKEIYDAALNRLRASGQQVTAEELVALKDAIEKKVFGIEDIYGQPQGELGSARAAFEQKYVTPSMKANAEGLARKAEADADYAAKLEAHKQAVLDYETRMKNASAPSPDNQVIDLKTKKPVVLPQETPPVAPIEPRVKVPDIAGMPIDDFIKLYQYEKDLLPKGVFKFAPEKPDEKKVTGLLKTGTQERRRIINEKGGAEFADTLAKEGKDMQAMIGLKDFLVARNADDPSVFRRITSAALSTNNPYSQAVRGANSSFVGRAVKDVAGGALTVPTAGIAKMRDLTKPLFDVGVTQGALGGIDYLARKNAIDLPERGLYVLSDKELKRKAQEEAVSNADETPAGQTPPAQASAQKPVPGKIKDSERSDDIIENLTRDWMKENNADPKNYDMIKEQFRNGASWNQITTKPKPAAAVKYFK